MAVAVFFFSSAARSLRRWFGLTGRKRLRRTSCSVSITLQRKYKCFVVPCVFSAAAERDAAPSCLECFHSDTVLHHARTAAYSGVKRLRSKFTRSSVFWRLFGAERRLERAQDSDGKTMMEIIHIYWWLMTYLTDWWFADWRVTSLQQSSHTPYKMSFLSLEFVFDVVSLETVINCPDSIFGRTRLQTSWNVFSFRFCHKCACVTNGS